MYYWKSAQQDSRPYNFCLKLLVDVQWLWPMSGTLCHSMWSSQYKYNPMKLAKPIHPQIFFPTLCIIMWNITKPLFLVIGLACYHMAWILITFCPTFLILYEHMFLRYHQVCVCSSLYLSSVTSKPTCRFPIIININMVVVKTCEVEVILAPHNEGIWNSVW